MSQVRKSKQCTPFHLKSISSRASVLEFEKTKSTLRKNKKLRKVQKLRTGVAIASLRDVSIVVLTAKPSTANNMSHSGANKDMTGSHSMNPNFFSGLSYQVFHTNMGLGQNATLGSQGLNTMGSSYLSQFPASTTSQAPPQPDIGNGQTHVGAIYHPQVFQEHPSQDQDVEQGELTLAPCVGCTRRMAKAKTNDTNTMRKIHACHLQSKQGTKACSACNKGGRGCIWIEGGSRLENNAMEVQWAFQRVKDHGGHYTREDKQYCKWALDELELKHPSKGGSKRRR